MWRAEVGLSWQHGAAGCRGTMLDPVPLDKKKDRKKAKAKKKSAKQPAKTSRKTGRK